MATEIGRVRDSGPIAYFLTWTTHGSWLPGDARGWVKRGGDIRPASHTLLVAVERSMTDSPMALSPVQRRLAHDAIDVACHHRGWTIHACQCRHAGAQGHRSVAPLLLVAGWQHAPHF